MVYCFKNTFKPATCIQVKVYKDDAVDAVSVVLIYKELKNSDGSTIDVEMLDSELRVVTRLDGRDSLTQKELGIPQQVYEDMLMKRMQ